MQSHLQNIIVETVVLMNQIDGALGHHHLHEFIQNFTADHRFLQLRRPKVWLASFQRYRFCESLDNSFTAPQTLMRFTRPFQRQRNILHRPHFACLFVAFILARPWYVMNRRLWQATFFTEFQIFGWQQFGPSIV